MEKMEYKQNKFVLKCLDLHFLETKLELSPLCGHSGCPQYQLCCVKVRAT